MRHAKFICKTVANLKINKSSLAGGGEMQGVELEDFV